MNLKLRAKQFIPILLLNLRERSFQKETHINRAIRAIKAKTYIEIGVQDARCFRQINAPKKIGIDPRPLPCDYLLKSNETFYQLASDEFFSLVDGLYDEMIVDVAFIDGLHEFTQVLRDLANINRFISEKGVVFIHDCNPNNRQLTIENNSDWTGDVWKIAYYIHNYWKELNFFTLDCDWGLCVVTGFSQYEHIPSQTNIDLCKNLQYEVLQENRKNILHLVPHWHSNLFFSLRHHTKRPL